jgi:hypothetical protein
MNEETAVEWLVSRINHGGLVSKKQFNELVDQAKQMEKEQIIEAHSDWRNRWGKLPSRSAEQYYKETFKSE